MEIFINGQSKVFPVGTSVKMLLSELSLLDQRGFAIAVNEQVVPRSHWDKQPLSAGDKIIVIQATAGG